MELILLFIMVAVVGGVRLSEKGAASISEKEWNERRSFAEGKFDEFKQRYCSKAFDILYGRDVSNESKQMTDETVDEINQTLGKCYEEWVEPMIYARLGRVDTHTADKGIRSLMKPRYAFKFGELFDDAGYQKEQEICLAFAQWYETEARKHGVNDRLIYVGAQDNTTMNWGKDEPKANNYVSKLKPSDIGFGRFMWRETAFYGKTRQSVTVTTDDSLRAKRIEKRESEKHSVKIY